MEANDRNANSHCLPKVQFSAHWRILRSTSRRPTSPSASPRKRTAEIVRVAGLKAGAFSATLAIPPGPVGMFTILPDLIKV